MHQVIAPWYFKFAQLPLIWCWQFTPTAATAGFRGAGADVHLRVELRRRPDGEDFRVRRASAAILSLPLQEEQPNTRLQMQKEASGLISEREADDSHEDQNSCQNSN